MNPKKWTTLVSLIFLFAAGLACNFTASTTQAPAFATEDPHLDVERVTLEEAKAAFDSGAAVFVDVRDAASYADSHIPGAVLIPLGKVESRMGELDADQWIITYCT